MNMIECFRIIHGAETLLTLKRKTVDNHPGCFLVFLRYQLKALAKLESW